MNESPDQILDRVKQNLLYVAREAEVLRPTELVLKSSELAAAASDIDELMNASGELGLLRLKIGRTVVNACSFRKNPYDFTEATMHLVEPGEEHELRFKYLIPTEPFNAYSPVKEPVYGFLRYFDLATMGRTLEDDGELTLTRPDSSVNE